MRALVIGGGGYIGKRLTSRLLRENWDVTSLTLPSRHRQLEDQGLKVLEGDRNNPEVLVKALAGEPDVVFDLIAYRPAQSQALVNSGAGLLGRLVHLSTVSVYRTFPEIGCASETAAIRFEGTEGGYGPDKARCERVLEQAAADSNFPYVVLRAGQLMGPGDPCSRQAYLVKRILASQPILHPGPEDGFLWLLFIDDLIEALVCAATAPVLRRTFHLAQEEAPTLRDHVTELARGLGMNPPPIRSPGIDRLIDFGFRIYGFAFARPINVPPDTTAARNALGWQCTPHHEAVAATLTDLRSVRATVYPAWPGRGTTQAHLSGAHEWIHAAREARVLAGAAVDVGPDADTVLSWLSDDPVIFARPQLVESEQWCSRVGGCLSSRHSTFVTVPGEFVHRLAASGGTWTPSSNGDEDEPLSKVPCDLVASVEADNWSETRGWIFTSSSSSLAHYGVSSEPQQFDFVSLANGLGMATSPSERLLLEMNCSEDVRTLVRFVQDCRQRRWLHVNDIANWSRLYIVGAASLLPAEIQSFYSSTGKGTVHLSSYSQPSPWRHHVSHSVWVLTHSVARLLCKAGLTGPATIRMGSQKASVGPSPSLLITAALCWVDTRAVVVDLAACRVIEVAPAIAEVLQAESGAPE